MCQLSWCSRPRRCCLPCEPALPLSFVRRLLLSLNQGGNCRSSWSSACSSSLQVQRSTSLWSRQKKPSSSLPMTSSDRSSPRMGIHIAAGQIYWLIDIFWIFIAENTCVQLISTWFYKYYISLARSFQIILWFLNLTFLIVLLGGVVIVACMYKCVHFVIQAWDIDRTVNGMKAVKLLKIAWNGWNVLVFSNGGLLPGNILAAYSISGWSPCFGIWATIIMCPLYHQPISIVLNWKLLLWNN